MSPTIRLTDTTATTIVSTSSTSRRNVSLARRQVSAAAPTSTIAHTATGVARVRSIPPV